MSFDNRYIRICSEYASFRLTKPPRLDGCTLCRGPLLNPDFTSCYLCGKHQEYLDGHRIDYLRCVSICFDDEQYYQDLINYKHPLLTPEQKYEYRYNLGIILHRFLVENSSMYEEMRPDLICWIPSTKRDYDPMAWIAKAVFREHARALLAWTGEMEEANRRTPDLTRFKVSEDVKGKSILVLDDLITSGSHVFSAAGTLKQAGAGQVSALALGRFVRALDYPEYKKAAKKEQYAWTWPVDEERFLY